MTMGSPRAAAARTIYRVLCGESLNHFFHDMLSKLDERRRPLCQELVYGTLREWPYLISVVERYLDKPIRRKDQDIWALICIGIYELDHLRTPAHAVLSETVSSTRELKKPWAKGLVNGVLRTHQRQQPNWFDELTKPAESALPGWLYDSLAEQYPENIVQIAEAARCKPPMALRVNRQRTDRDHYAATLTEAGATVSTANAGDDGLVLSSPMDVAELPHFADGWASVQDISAQCAGALLAPKEGERILDACAAPGGKACHLLEIQPALKELIAMDISESRMQRIQENCDRLGLRTTMLIADASKPPAELLPESLDAILADVPCSATGVMRRNPDIKILRQAGDIASFTSQQLAILKGLWPLLKPGGRLLYVTCSLLEQENDSVIETFNLANDCTVENISLGQGLATKKGWQVLPHKTGGDGLFFSLIRKPKT